MITDHHYQPSICVNCTPIGRPQVLRPPFPRPTGQTTSALCRLAPKSGCTKNAMQRGIGDRHLGLLLALNAALLCVLLADRWQDPRPLLRSHEVPENQIAGSAPGRRLLQASGGPAAVGPAGAQSVCRLALFQVLKLGFHHADNRQLECCHHELQSFARACRMYPHSFSCTTDCCLCDVPRPRRRQQTQQTCCAW